MAHELALAGAPMAAAHCSRMAAVCSLTTTGTTGVPSSLVRLNAPRLQADAVRYMSTGQPLTPAGHGHSAEVPDWHVKQPAANSSAIVAVVGHVGLAPIMWCGDRMDTGHLSLQSGSRGTRRAHMYTVSASTTAAKME
jgi:hypothetical protein